MRRFSRIALIAAGCLLLARVGFTLAQMQFQRGFIPAKIKTGMFYAEGDCGDFLSYQGAQVFGLSGDTVAELNAQGVHFFDDIDAPGNRAGRMYYGGVWKPTPLSGADDRGDGALMNMYCAMGRSWAWPKGIPEALRRSGGFYQTRGGRYLIVLPKEGYVVAVASDR